MVGVPEFAVGQGPVPSGHHDVNPSDCSERPVIIRAPQNVQEEDVVRGVRRRAVPDRVGQRPEALPENPGLIRLPRIGKVVDPRAGRGSGAEKQAPEEGPPPQRTPKLGS